MTTADGSRGGAIRPRRAIPALLVGALVAGFGFSLLKMAIYRVGLGGGDVVRDGWNGSVTATIIDGLVLSFVYSVILLIALLIWSLLQRMVLRTWWTAALFGMVVTALVWVGLLMAFHMPLQAMRSLGALIAAMVLANGAAGIVVWRLTEGQETQSAGMSDDEAV
jgi:hypothetical protein